MKLILCSVSIDLFLVVVFINAGIGAFNIDPITQNEMNRRLHVPGAMGGNITLTSNSSLGSGAYAFVLKGETNDGTPVAIKVTSIKELDAYTQEYKCYKQMNATMDKVCEKYGIPFIYHSGDFLNHKTMAMTMLDFDVESLQRKIGEFSKDSILIIFRDVIKTLKFIHSKGFIHYDIHLGNIMTKGANIFMIDFNSGGDKIEQNLPKFIDVVRLFDAMSTLVGMKVNCDPKGIVNSGNAISEEKRKMKVELLKQMKYTELVEPYVEVCFDAVEAMQMEQLPKYDDLYKMFDDVLYTGQNRSQRIVFEWLTPEERAAAMSETILPIESIIFPRE